MRTTGFTIFLIGAFSSLNVFFDVIASGLPNYGGVALIVLGAFLMISADKKKAELARQKQCNKSGLITPQPIKFNRSSLKNKELQNLDHASLNLQSQLN
jgi:hypothetical protein